MHVRTTLSIVRRWSTQKDAYHPSVDGTLLPAVTDQILVDKR